MLINTFMIFFGVNETQIFDRFGQFPQIRLTGKTTWINPNRVQCVTNNDHSSEKVTKVATRWSFTGFSASTASFPPVTSALSSACVWTSMHKHVNKAATSNTYLPPPVAMSTKGRTNEQCRAREPRSPLFNFIMFLKSKKGC